jgi:DNA-directed RNA polymerase specialized sigma24 family protein
MTAGHDQVVERTRGPDADAWRSLVDAHLPLVRAICTAYGLDDPAAAGVNQLVWLRLAEHLPRIRIVDALGGWVAATARGECLHHRWSAARNRAVVAAIGSRPGAVDGEVAAAFSRLGGRCQRLLRLLLTEPRLPEDQVCAALDVAAGDIEAQGAHCLERLGRMLAIDADAARDVLQQLVATSGTVPDAWREAAGVAFGWLVLEASRAELVYEVAGAQERRVRCVAGPDGVDLAFETSDDEVLVSGQLTPGRQAKVTARWPDGTLSTGSDDEGAFHLDRLPRVPLSLHVDGPAPFKTGWIVP